jgi:hypothetical protein
MTRYDEKQVDALAHELTELLGFEFLQKLSASSHDVIRRHTTACSDCRAKYDKFLDAYSQSLPPEKRARMEAVAKLLAAEISEETEQNRYRALATAEAMRQGKPELVVEAQKRIQRRQSLFAEFKEAFKLGDTEKMECLAQELRASALEKLSRV